MASHDLEESFDADDLAIDGVEFAADGARAESLAVLIWLSELSRDERIRAATQLGNPEVLDEPKTIGRYRLEALLGTGGYGAVFRAIDCQLNRPVALKLAWPSILVDPEASRRFVEEPRTTAGLAHEGIVDVRDSGMIELVPFIALELIEGPTLAQWMARQSHVRPEIAAEIIRCVAGAVDCAHTLGIIHRDLKPSNILLSPAPGRTTLPFQPMVTDFGLARRPPGIELSLITGTSVIIGTDPYLSPEQAAGNGEEIGAASDIFSLGVILYELVAGRRPFEGESAAATRELIQNEEPLAIRRWRRGVPKDLETIILKCLEKAPDKRYESARELADDLDRFLKDEPIRARRISLLQRGWKTARRKPMVVALASTVLLAGLFVAGLTGAWITDRVSASKQFAAAEGAERQHRYAAIIQQADEAVRRGNRGTVVELLEQSRSLAGGPVQPGIEWNYLWAEVNDADLRWRAHDGNVHVVRFSPSGDVLASAGEDGLVICWDTASWSKSRELRPKMGDINALEFSEDGTLLAVAGDDGRVVVYQTKDCEPIFDEPVVNGHALTLAWLGSELKFAIGGIGPVLTVVDPIARTQNKSRPLGFSATGLPENTYKLDQIDNVIYLKACGALVVDARPASRHFIDPLSLEVIESFKRPGRSALAVAGTGSDLFVAPSPNTSNGPEPSSLSLIRRDNVAVASLAMPLNVQSLRFSRSGNVFMAAADNGTAWSWRTADVLAGGAMTCRRFVAHDNRASSVDMSPDGTCLASGGSDGHVNVWRDCLWHANFDAEFDNKIVDICFSPCGRWLAIVSAEPTAEGERRRVRLFEVATGELLWTESMAAYVLAPTPQWSVFSPVGETVVFLDTGYVFSERDVRTGRVTMTYKMPQNERVQHVNYSPDPNLLEMHTVKTSETRWENKGFVHQFDRRTGDVHASQSVTRTECFGQHQTAVGYVWVQRSSRELVLSESLSSEPAVSLSGFSDLVRGIAVSPDGRMLVAGDEQGTVYSWDLLHPSTPRKYLGHHSAISQLCVCRAGDRILSLSRDGTMRIWDVATGNEMVRVGTTEEPVLRMALHPADEMLVLAVENSGKYGLKTVGLGKDRAKTTKSLGRIE